ncbi:MAG: PDZ domain-containing protein [Vicinamibacterales bacterium]
MSQHRTIVLGGVLAAVIGVAVAGVAAQRDDRDRDRDRRQRGHVFIGPDGTGRALRLDGRGSQIGVMVSDPDDAATQGVRIDGVDAGSPAETAGAREGDLVVEFDGERVRSARQLSRLVQETPDGRTVTMTLSRDGSRQSVQVTPEAAAGTAAWTMDLEPGLRAELERGLRGLRELPDRGGPRFDFRFDGVPGLPGSRARLGVQVETLTDQLAEYFGVKGGGVLVSSVTADSPAAAAGLKAGDVITAVNGTAIRVAGELVEALGEVGTSGDARVEIVRDKKSATLTATIDRPARRRTPRQPA